VLNYVKLKTESDFEKARNYCKEHGIEFPKTSKVIFGALGDTGILRGISAVVVNVQIEPLIADTALTGQILVEKALACASVMTNQVEVVINESNQDVIDYAVRTGFVEKDRNMVILRKEI
jgi:hypothetical protein